MAYVVATEKGEKIIVDKVKKEKDPNYSVIYATGAFGGPNGPYDFRINFYDGGLAQDENGEYYERRTINSSVILSYASAKQLADWILGHLESYEKEMGHEIYAGKKDLTEL
jgi:hypothetical protein